MGAGVEYANLCVNRWILDVRIDKDKSTYLFDFGQGHPGQFRN